MSFTRKRALYPFIGLLIIVILSMFLPGIPSAPDNGARINPADVAWMLCATGLVLLMTPGLAFFYGGMVNRKNVISTMLQSFVCMAIITILWVVVGFSLAFGKSVHGFIGNPTTYFMMRDVVGGNAISSLDGATKLAPTIPLILFAFYQLKFAIITPALITGAFAGRIKFSSYLLFICLFSLFIYAPLAHVTWHPDGLLCKLGVLDFAGGTVVHISAGMAALASALYLKKHNETRISPARVSYVILGSSLLWFGWLGFNAGSAFGANAIAATALATTSTASGAAAFTWMIFDTIRGHKPSAMGCSIGAVVGLVAITPAAGFVSIPHSLTIGIVSAIISNLMVVWRTKRGIDDTLDVFPCHGVGGITGMILTGVFANHNINSAVSTNGLFFGETKLFFIQLSAVVGVILFAFIGTFILLKITDLITPLRVSSEEEAIGLDMSQHGERL